MGGHESHDTRGYSEAVLEFVTPHAVYEASLAEQKRDISWTREREPQPSLSLLAAFTIFFSRFAA